VLVQAGSSDTGRRFAARHADAVFTAHMAKATAQEFCADLKRLAAAEGRLPDPAVGARFRPDPTTAEYRAAYGGTLRRGGR
jgi:alkanesulfonate monooxygenase SsuD/methylene tetrahydromethanopterin reductase-like flavin-dependent oxidoreductase (luciferase family)